MTVARLEARVYEDTPVFELVAEFDASNPDKGDKSRMIRKAVELWLTLNKEEREKRCDRCAKIRESLFYI